MSIENLKAEIERREDQRLTSKRQQYQSKNCIASNLGECLKERYHSIVDWDKKPMADNWLQARFEEGVEQERRILIKLMNNGFDFTEGQKRFELKDRSGRCILSGKIEGKIKFDGKFYPFEIKSMNPNIYAGVDRIEDFEKYSHTRKYPKQLMAYMYSENCDEGFFIITDCLGHFKILPIKLDYQMMEQEMQNCELVQTCVEQKKAPAFTENKALCRKCWAAKTCCFPSIDFGEGIEIISDEELSVDLKRRDELMDSASEYEAIDKKIKERVKSSYKHALCDNYEITVKEYPINHKAQEARTITAKKVIIERIDLDSTVEAN